MTNRALSEFQGQRDMLKEQNKQRDMNLLMEQGHQRGQVGFDWVILSMMRSSKGTD